jgi:hypothetical protein
MPKINVILVDYENVQVNLDILRSINVENLEIYIFVGENQKNTSMELLENILELYKSKIKIELIRIKGTGKNALDFHIAYFIGKLSKENENYFFHIISKDTGFDILIEYLKKEEKIKCLREEKIEEIPIIEMLKAETIPQKANVFRKKLVKSPTNPKKEKTLISAIIAHFAKSITETEAKDIINFLEKEKILSIDDNGKVSYPTREQEDSFQP